jgi:SagB-type dehydrogenase family enzyme
MSKIYSRLRQIELPEFPMRGDNLRKLLLKRFSYRNFSKKAVTLKQLSEILYYSAGIVRKVEGELRRPYPSAGAKYPIEIYPLILVNNEVQKGLYHYDPANHSLDVLLDSLKNSDISGIWKTQQWFKKASIILILTAAYTRTTEKYGEVGLAFPFIEAGHIGQNVYLLAQSMEIGCCAIGQFNEKPLCELLDINIFEEYPIYYIALGN